MPATMENSYGLRCELRGHAEDVRSLLVKDTAVFTGSRDRTIKLWKQRDGQEGLCEELSYVGHTDFVTALAHIPAGTCEQCTTDCLVSGSRDNTVRVWKISDASTLQVLEGHRYQVTAVVVTPSGDIYSASLDKTIRRWRNGECVQVLEGHDAAVLCLLLLPNGDLASGSGDCTVKIWSGDKCIHTIQAHSDSVRGLALLPGVGVISASHDHSLKVWTYEGDCVSQLVGHTALVYCCAATEDGLIASGSEDNTLRLWKADGTCLQTIEHPGNLWAVGFLGHSDVVTACADHVARVWTSDAARQSADAQQVFDQVMVDKREAAAAAAASGAVGSSGGLPAGLKLEDPVVLMAPGSKDGQTVVVREGGAGVAYSWDAAKSEWERIGEVVGGPGGEDTMAAGSKWHNGQMWDYVFDVDWEDGAPPKKLALNRGDNPYVVADAFLEQEGLPATYREQVVQFILQNTQGTSALPPPPSFNPDPYTGGGAYVPGLQPARGAGAAGSAAAYADPFTGAGAYVPPPMGMAANGSAGGMGGGHSVTGGGADPFTGGTAVASHHVPAKAFLLYDAVPNTDAMRRKIMDLSAQLSSDPATAQLALTEEEAVVGGLLDSLLDSASRPPARSGKFEGGAQLGLLQKMLSWPAPQLFPALDLARLAALDATAAETLARAAGKVSPGSQPGSLGRAMAIAGLAEPPLVANQQTVLRLVCNCFLHSPLLLWLQPQGDVLLDTFARCTSSGNKNVRQGIAALLVNLAVLLGKIPAEELEFKARILGLAMELLQATPADDQETRFRAAIAIGTMARESGKVRGMCRDLGLLRLMQQLKASGGKAGEAAVEAEQIMRL